MWIQTIIRTPLISKFQPYHLHQVLRFSTLFTTIPPQKLLSRLATYIQNSFIPKNWNRKYQFWGSGLEGPFFVKEHSDSKCKYTEDIIINMLEFQVDNIFVDFGGKGFQHIVGIPLGTNCVPLLADIFLIAWQPLVMFWC